MVRLPAPKLSNYYLWCDLAMWTIAKLHLGRAYSLGSAKKRGSGNKQGICPLMK